MALPNFSRRTVAPAAAPTTPIMQLPTNGPPLPSGRPSRGTANYVPQDAAEQLKVVGYEEGDELPPDLADHIAAIQRDLNAASPGLDMTNRQPAKIPPVVNISDMPLEKQQELRGYLADYKATMQGLNAQAAAEPLGRPQTMPTATFTNDFKPPAPPPVAVVQPPEPTQLPDTGANPKMHNCKRCNWDQRQAFDPKPTPEDIQIFTASILGDTRFEKTYMLLGGQLQLRLRSMTTAEIILVTDQLRCDFQAGLLTGVGSYHAWERDYCTAISVASIARAGKPIEIIPPIGEIAYDAPPVANGTPPTETALKPMLKWYAEEVANNSSLQRMIQEQLAQFWRLQKVLEEMAADPDFLHGIER